MGPARTCSIKMESNRRTQQHPKVSTATWLYGHHVSIHTAHVHSATLLVRIALAAVAPAAVAQACTAAVAEA
jgi:hypothetical protein